MIYTILLIYKRGIIDNHPQLIVYKNHIYMFIRQTFNKIHFSKTMNKVINHLVVDKRKFYEYCKQSICTN